MRKRIKNYQEKILTRYLFVCTLLVFSGSMAITDKSTILEKGPVKVDEENVGSTIQNSIKSFKSIQSQSQEQDLIVVKGTVTDEETNEPIMGVNIILEPERTKGAVTDLNGNYSIEVPSNGKLAFSSIGYESQVVEIKGQMQINVVMLSSTTDLDAVVVIGYGQQSKVTTTGAISSIKAESIERSSLATIGDAVAGKIPGVSSVQTGGMPGLSDPNIYIRGIATMNSSNPFIMIDGVEGTLREFNQLNPSNIESISVLKDAASTAVFGVRGANGVIMVTSKRGKVGKAKISAGFTYGSQVPTELQDFTNSYEWALGKNELYRNDGDLTRLISDEVLMHYKNQDLPMLYPDYSYVDELFQNSAPQTRSNIDIRGGTEKVKYFTSVGYFKQAGLVEIPNVANFDYNRFTIQANIDVKVTPSTELKFTNNVRVGSARRPNEGAEARNNGNLGAFWRPLNQLPPVLGGLIDGQIIKPHERYLPTDKSYETIIDRMYGKGYYFSTETRLNMNIELTQKLDKLSPALEGLTFRTRIGYRAGNNNDGYLNKNGNLSYISLYNKDAVTPNPEIADSTVVLIRNGVKGAESYEYIYGANRNIYLEAGFDYKRSFGKHNVTGLMLYNQSKDYYPNLTYSNIPTGNVGMVGRVNYNYNEQYIVEFNAGYNGSENFAPENRFGFFPAASAAWVVSEENFMKKNVPFINQMKLRASYGIVGSDQAGRNARFIYIGDSYNTNVNKWHGYNFGNEIPDFQPGVHEQAVGNSDVTWETATKQNYGIDLSLFNNSLDITFEYFHEYRNDILMRRNAAPTYNSITLPPVNIGEMENKGFEIQIAYNGKAGDFRYNLSTNLSRAQNKVLFIDEVPPQEDYQSITGKPFNINFGYIWEGFYTQDIVDVIEQQKVDGTLPENRQYPIPTIDVQPGDMMYKDLNNDGVVDRVDRKPFGKPFQPQIFGGFIADLGYKNFDLNIALQGAAEVSRNIRGVFREPYGNTGDFSALRTSVENSWTPERAAAGTVLWPRLTQTNGQYNWEDSTFWNRDSSYLRLRTVELGYTFGKSLLDSISFERVRLFVRGTNLFTLTKKEYNLIDPERNPATDVSYPLMQIFDIGINFTF